MKLTENEKKHLYDEIYNMKGFGLCNYLNSWITCKQNTVEEFGGTLSIDPTQHGWKILIIGNAYEFGTIMLFNRWDEWRHEVAYYFDGFIRESELIERFDDPEKLKEYFVYTLCSILNILDDLEKYFEIDKPKIKQNDPLFFM